MSTCVVKNVTKQWLILNSLNVKIPPEEVGQELLIDSADMDNPDIVELLNAKKIRVSKPTEKKQEPKAGKKRGRKPAAKKEKVAAAKKTPRLRESGKDKPSKAIVVQDGVPVTKEFTKNAEATIFIDEHGKKAEVEEKTADEGADAFIEIE